MLGARRRCGLPLLLLMMVSAAPAGAQLVRGTVVDDATGAGVGAASVVAVGGGDVAVASAIADSAGLFLLRLPAAGAYTLRASRIGYVEVEFPLAGMGPGDEVSLIIRMGATAVPLEPVAIVGRRSFNPALMAGFYQRAAAARPRNDGRIMLREDLARMNVSQSSEYLRNVPSLQLRPVGTGQGRGSRPVLRRLGEFCEPAVYLNGNRISGHNIDSFVPVGTLEGLEVYTRGDEPAEFWDRTDCGVILLWSRSDTDGERLSWGRAAKLAALVAGFAGLFAVLR